MPSTKDAVHVYFDEIQVTERKDGKDVVRKKTKCNFCGHMWVCNSVERMKLHLAARMHGEGSLFRCKKVPDAVRRKYDEELRASSAKKAEQRKRKRQEAAIRNAEDGRLHRQV